MESIIKFILNLKVKIYLSEHATIYIKTSGVLLCGEGMNDIGTILVDKLEKTSEAGQLSLVQRCFSQKGRHNFVMGNGSAGNVFLDCKAVNPYSTSEPHANWVTGGLYDNIKAPLTARYWKDIIMGWTGANIVFWNCEGDFLIQSPPTAKNYSFGHIGVNAVIFNTFFQDLTRSKGHVESMDRRVTPKSLYLTQR
jgi:hypothetical protein